MVDADDRIVDWRWNVGTAIPAVFDRDEYIHVRESVFSATTVNHVASKHKHLIMQVGGGGGEASGDAGDGSLLFPFAGVEIELEGLVADRIPRFLRPMPMKERIFTSLPSRHMVTALFESGIGRGVSLGWSAASANARKRRTDKHRANFLIGEMIAAACFPS